MQISCWYRAVSRLPLPLLPFFANYMYTSGIYILYKEVIKVDLDDFAFPSLIMTFTSSSCSPSEEGDRSFLPSLCVDSMVISPEMIQIGGRLLRPCSVNPLHKRFEGD